MEIGIAEPRLGLRAVRAPAEVAEVGRQRRAHRRWQASEIRRPLHRYGTLARRARSTIPVTPGYATPASVTNASTVRRVGRSTTDQMRCPSQTPAGNRSTPSRG